MKKEGIQKQKLSNLTKTIYRIKGNAVVRTRQWHITGSNVYLQTSKNLKTGCNFIIDML